MIRRSFTKTQLNKQCGLQHQQDIEFETWLQTQEFNSVCDMSQHAFWDTIGQKQKPWSKYQKGQGPWDLIMYGNNSEIVELGAVCNMIDNLRDQTTATAQIYMALNKWCVRVNDIDSKLLHLDFDTAILHYVQQRLKNFRVLEYRYIPNDRGGLGTWIHGNNRFWLKKHEKN
jgi:hypothetical protein